MNNFIPSDPDDRLTDEPVALQMIENLDTFKVITTPLRVKILNLLAVQAMSVNQLAKELAVPFTRLYYHLQLLEKHGVIRLVATRALPGAVEEKFYRATAYDYRPAIALRTINGVLNPEWEKVTIHSMLQRVRESLYQSLATGLIDLTVRPPHPKALGGTQRPLRLSPARARELHERLQALVAEFVTNPGTDAPQDYLLQIMLFPVTVDDQEEREEREERDA